MSSLGLSPCGEMMRAEMFSPSCTLCSPGAGDVDGELGTPGLWGGHGGPPILLPQHPLLFPGHCWLQFLKK